MMRDLFVASGAEEVPSQEAGSSWLGRDDFFFGQPPKIDFKVARPHQDKALRLLRESMRGGHRRPLLQLPTGSGKTYIATQVVKGALAKGNSVVFVVPFLSLIEQTIQAFLDEGIGPIGVIQAGHPMTDSSCKVQVASAQTLARRSPPKADLVIVDEAHVGSQVIRKWMASEPELRFIGLSATPWRKGMANEYDDLVVGATLAELIEAKVLAEFIAFAPSRPDLAGVKLQAGDFDAAQLSKVMSQDKLVADVVTTWLEKGENRPTLCFAVDRAHAKHLQASFAAAGVSCGYVDAHTDDVERRLIRRRFQDGDLRVVCNVGTLTTGVDWDVRCIILARPTKSEMLYVQMVGRGLRTAAGKEDCLILDHSDNTLRMGFVTDVGHDALFGGEAKARQPRVVSEALPKLCSKCSFLKAACMSECPNCGFVPERQTTVKTGDGELTRLKGKQKLITDADRQDWYSQCLGAASQWGHKAGWAEHMFRDKFGSWPDGLSKTATAPGAEVLNFIRSRQIAYHNGRKRRAA